jgi:RNA polymerase sigma-70 factor (ECF subfamily)
VEPSGLSRHEAIAAHAPPREAAHGPRAHGRGFDRNFSDLFDAHFSGLYRFLDRLSGEPELAADLAQETFLRLYRRRSLPDRPEAWLITVALNLFRNQRSMRARRRILLTASRGERLHSDPPPAPGVGVDKHIRERVRAAIDGLSERDRALLLLRAEGFAYRDIARALDLNEGSVGTLLARAKRAFRNACGDLDDASR